MIRQFKYEDYPQVAVNVDMLNTGFDCREILHLVMCRPVLSPILYQQIRGRGTRTDDCPIRDVTVSRISEPNKIESAVRKLPDL